MNVQFVILAAGKGKRMGDPETPKVLNQLHGRPLISYLIDTVNSIAQVHPPIIVVGYKADMVKQALGPQFKYALQAEQLGTAHAVMAAREYITADHIIVLNGDMPFISAQTIQNMAHAHAQSNAVITMATVQLSDYSDWRDSFLAWGRILRDNNGAITSIREYKDASEAERGILEVNTGWYVFNTDWLFNNLGAIGNVNAQGEYYLTDAAALALSTGHAVPTVAVEAVEAIGINTKDHLEHAESIIPKQHELILE